MRKLREILIVVSVIAALGIYWFCSEEHFARSVSPKGLSTVAQYIERFGDPALVHQVDRNGKIYYMLFGHGPSLPVFAFPSSPPTYVFDSSGTFVEWCLDRGETNSGYNERWPLTESGRVDVGTFKQRFGLR